MNKIIFSLNFQMHGAAVVDLQGALRLLLDRRLILPNDEAVRRELSTLLQRESAKQIYLDATGKLVSLFQEENQLHVTGSVDEPTAAALNNLLEKLGALSSGQNEDETFVLRGQVVDVNGPVNGIQVTVFDRDLFFLRDSANIGQQLGTDITRNFSSKNGEGRFEFTYQTSDFAVGDILSESNIIPDLIFTLSNDGQPLKDFQIYRLPDGKELPEEIVVSEDDLILGIQPRRVEEVRILILGAESKVQMSEYEHLWRAIEPLLPDQAAKNADAIQREMLVCAAATRFDEEKHRDFSFVARETGLNLLLIQKFANACRLARDPFKNSPTASVFYALARIRSVSDLLTLARLSTNDIRLALQQASMDVPPIIPSFDPADGLEEAVRSICDGLAKHLPNYRSAEGAPSLADLLGADLPNPDVQATLWRIYSDHVGTATEFWQKLQGEPGFGDPNTIAKVKYTFQLGLLAQNNIPLVNAIRSQHPDVTDTGELAFRFSTADKWTALLDKASIPIPLDVPGPAEDHKANYAASLACALQIAHPTAAVANLIASLPATHLADLQPAVATFLVDAVRKASFDLATGRIDDLLAQHGDKLLETVDQKNRDTLIDQVKRVQRLFRLSSGPESLKILLDAGFHSARDLAEMPPEVVMEKLKPMLGETATRLMINRANSITLETIHKFVLVNDEINRQLPQTLKRFEVSKEMGDVTVQPGPDYASLFGSVELCDCQHCCSIYSPAAYLVDLLQSLDLKISAVAPLDILIGNSEKKVIGRRPDIAHLQLSCDNTNITLPYVDLVNEVLESYIIFSQTLPLQTDKAGVVLVPPVPEPNETSFGATAAELTANPENMRVLAYEALEKAVYPFTLPFNQPIAALRLTLEQMGSSRHEVMDLFRQDDSEAVGRALDIEALKMTERDFTILTGETFDAVLVVKQVSDFYGFEVPAAPTDTAWVAGDLPAGAQQHVVKDSWTFTAFNPPPPSGTTPHASGITTGLHQHYFDNIIDAGKLTVGNEDFLFAEIFLDPDNMPEEVMLQWNDGTWEHRAYWGLSKIAVGIESTASLRYMGPLPSAGEWVRLEVPVYFVGLAGRNLSGMAFTLFGGGATWGMAGKRTPSWIERMMHVPTLLARTGVTYVELVDLLATHYINPALPQAEVLEAFVRIPVSYKVLAGLVANKFTNTDAQTLKALSDAGMTTGDLSIWAAEHFEILGKLIVLDAPDSVCDLTLTRLQHLDGTAPNAADLSRLHRFIRLWRKLGWSARDLDRSFVSLQAAEVTPTFLRQLGQIVQMQAKLKLTSQEMLSFWGNIPTEGDDALYHKLFLNKAVREIDVAFAAVDGQFLPVAAGLKIKDHVPALLAGLRTRADDLALIRKHTNLDNSDSPLTLSTATALYRYVMLARALAMAVKDLIDLQTFSGEMPFSTLLDPYADFIGIDPAQTLRFVRLADRVKESGFIPASLSYLFNNISDAPPSLTPQYESIRPLFVTIREGLVRVAVENTLVDDPTGEVTRAKLGLLFEPHIVEQIAGLVAGSQVYTAPLTAKPAAMPGSKITYDEVSHLLKTTGWLTDADRDPLLALPNIGGYHAAVTSLYEQPRDLLKQTLTEQLGWTMVETDLKTSVLEATSLRADGTLEPTLVADKFKVFLTEMLPYLRRALSRAFVKQALADALDLEVATAAPLLEGAQDFFPLHADADKALPAISDFLALSGNGLNAFYFENVTFTEPSRARGVDSTINFRWGVKHGFSVRWQGKVLAEKTQRYQFHLRAGGGVQFMIDGELLIDRLQDIAPAEYTVDVDLEADKLYDLKLDYFNQVSDALIELRWSSPAAPAQIVPSYRLYSNGDVIKSAYRTFVRLHKASLLVNGFKFTPREITYLSDPARADVFDLNELPVEAAIADQQALFRAWVGWNEFATLRDIAVCDRTSLLDCMTASTVPEAQAALVRALGWDASALAALAGPQGFDLKEVAYKDTAALLNVANSMRLLSKLGAQAAEVLSWAVPVPTMEQAHVSAQTVKRALKAQYDNEAWLEIARSIADQLREGQRAALVAYLLPRLGFSDPDQLFGHFLIDVEMGSCMQTSRIKQAISSVQLFIQRCRMNLEPEVAPKMIDSIRWNWRRNYRLWEANLKVFLYPENWIEPELRDDKSPFFRELESELLQGEITTENAEIALGNYLEKVDTVSQLKICGMYTETPFTDEQCESVLHVFGRTFTTPRVFYYRRLVTVDPVLRYWTAWEKVPLDIEANEVLPLIWNRRLYLFWPVKTQQANSKQPDDIPFQTIRMAWSEYRQGKWLPKHVTAADKAFVVKDPLAVKMRPEIRGDELTIVFARAFPPECFKGTQIHIEGVEKGIGKSTGPQCTAEIERQGSITFLNYNGLVESISGPNKSTIVDRGYTYFNGSATGSGFGSLGASHNEILVFGPTPNADKIRFFSPGYLPYTLNDPYFIQEGRRAYLVMPHNFASPSLDITAGAVPYYPHYDSPALKFVETTQVNTKNIDQDLNQYFSRPLQAQLNQWRKAPNSWIANGAGIALAEMRTLATPALTSGMKGEMRLSIDSQIFQGAVLRPNFPLQIDEPAEFRFETFFHPYTPEFQKRLNRYGVPGLLNIGSQDIDSKRSNALPKLTSFKEAYDPKHPVKQPWPEHKVDFGLQGAYSLYNWEIFFHVPLFLAVRLSQNQRFEEAMYWFHFIFDPTASASLTEPTPQCYWNVLPFRTAQPLGLQDMLKAMNAGNAALIAQWNDLQIHPFEPHHVARMRPLAYQKTVVMKYIDNLISWADQLFQRDTIESINQATHLYVMAAELLGPLPQRLTQRGRKQPKTYQQLRSIGLDKLNQAMVLFENDLPFSSHATSDSLSEASGLLGIGRTFYFCIPKNDKLLGYWDTVADRLFKIRHCMNIQGVVRELPLFEPHIDPALLVRAVAQGIDLSSVLNDFSAPLPLYRFANLLGKALELTGELRSLGAALLAALEKRDAEHLTSIRATHETELLSLMSQIKQRQLEEAKIIEEGLQKSYEVTLTRYNFYKNIPPRIAEETNQLNELKIAQDFQIEAQSAESSGSDIATYAPDISMGASMPVPPKTPITFSLNAVLGRGNVIAYYQAMSREKNFEASGHTFHANESSILSGWKRRADDWKLQENLAFKELAQIEKQIAAANMRVTIAQQELDNTARQIEQSQDIEEFLRTKFSSTELYRWMQGEISTIYFQCYQMAYDLAKKTERCYRFERGLVNSNFIQFGAWDSLRKGLLSGERLYLQLKQMDRAYQEGNSREYELTKNYSLVQSDPLGLIGLKERGWCEIELPETLFDLDFPGHYMRRIKSVSLTIPAVIGPYAGVNCTLTLLRDKTRVKSVPVEGYMERDGEEDDRFLTSWTRMQAIATSTAQNDAGLFELNFRDERYLPFEGAGVMSRWRIELPRDFRQFDYDTISDVVLHIKYTARDGGVPLRDAAITNLKQKLKEAEGKPQTRLFSLRHEFPDEWRRLQTVADAKGDHIQAFSLGKHRFPFVFKDSIITVNGIDIFGIPMVLDKNAATRDLTLSLNDPKNVEIKLKKADAVGLLVHKSADTVIEVKSLGATMKEADWTLKVAKADIPTLEGLEDILILCHYTVDVQ